jgi:sulfite reductase beta subunit-like hemoprotein
LDELTKNFVRLTSQRQPKRHRRAFVPVRALLAALSALADTQTDGKRLATCSGAGNKQVHITGCAKSCAALAPLPHTLLARSTGRYDLYAQETFRKTGLDHRALGSYWRLKHHH